MSDAAENTRYAHPTFSVPTHTMISAYDNVAGTGKEYPEFFSLSVALGGQTNLLSTQKYSQQQRLCAEAPG